MIMMKTQWKKVKANGKREDTETQNSKKEVAMKDVKKEEDTMKTKMKPQVCLKKTNNY